MSLNDQPAAGSESLDPFIYYCKEWNVVQGWPTWGPQDYFRVVTDVIGRYIMDSERPREISRQEYLYWFHFWDDFGKLNYHPLHECHDTELILNQWQEAAVYALNLNSSKESVSLLFCCKSL